MTKLNTGTTFEIITGGYKGYTGVVRWQPSAETIYADITNPDDDEDTKSNVAIAVDHIAVD